MKYWLKKRKKGISVYKYLLRCSYYSKVQYHQDAHDVLRAVTVEVLAGEGEEEVLGVQMPVEAQHDSRTTLCHYCTRHLSFARNRL